MRKCTIEFLKKKKSRNFSACRVLLCAILFHKKKAKKYYQTSKENVIENLFLILEVKCTRARKDKLACEHERHAGTRPRKARWHAST